MSGDSGERFRESIDSRARAVRFRASVDARAQAGRFRASLDERAQAARNGQRVEPVIPGRSDRPARQSRPVGLQQTFSMRAHGLLMPFEHKSHGALMLDPETGDPVPEWSGPRTGLHPVVGADSIGLRHFALANIPVHGGGVKPIPFYTHSQSNYKEGVNRGDWLPVLGINRRGGWYPGWFNKTEGVENHYGSPLLQKAAQMLASAHPERVRMSAPGGGDPAKEHINHIMRTHWGVSDIAMYPGDPVVKENVRSILNQIHGPGSA